MEDVFYDSGHGWPTVLSPEVRQEQILEMHCW